MSVAPPEAPAAETELPPPPTGAAPMVWADHVSKWFGDVVAVSDVSFTLGPGVTALLGPNGAGKSTMLRLLCGLVPCARGQLRILGRDPRGDLDVRRYIGLVPQQEAVFDNQSALEFVTLAAILHQLPHPEASARWVLGLVELDPDDRRKLTAYSRGMRQRVKVAASIVHDPLVIILDEPLTGLDPRQRRHMTELFHHLGDQGRCVIVSSHVLEEVERFGSNVLVIAQGRLAAEGDFRAIRDLMDDRPHRLRVRTDRPYQVAGGLLAAGTVVAIRLEGHDAVLVDTVDVHRFRRSVAAIARDADAHLSELVPLDDDLDSVFRYLVS